MKIYRINAQLEELYRRILIQNECGGDMKYAYKFDNASPESGYSFGIAQLDISHNAHALQALKEMEEFTTDEIEALRRKDPSLNMAALNARLRAHSDIIYKYDSMQIVETLEKCNRYCSDLDVDFQDPWAFLAVCDYDNQLNLSKGGKMYTWLLDLKQTLTIEMVRDFKLQNTLWGQQHPADVDRRYRGILKVKGA